MVMGMGNRLMEAVSTPYDASDCLKIFGKNGRSERIRTSGPCLPKTVLYQAELHSVLTGRGYSAVDWLSQADAVAAAMGPGLY